jgi:hypothetical protein
MRQVQSGLVGLLLATVLMVASAGVANAATPSPVPSVPYTVTSVSFDTAQPLEVWAYPSFTPTPTAWWGPAAGGVSGMGLWCAGTQGASSYPFFPLNTGGDAAWNVPDTSDYYTSSLRFSYKWPLPADYTDFALRWFDEGANPKVAAPSSSSLPDPTNAYVTREYPRTSGPTSLQNKTVSSAAGTLEFQFMDWEHNAIRGPVCPGVTIDNLQVTGWRYGKVQSLEASRVSDTGVLVSWGKPKASPNSDVEAAGSPTYRVWRHDLRSDSWVEVTSESARVPDSERSIVDTSAATGGVFEYWVQAWGSGQEAAAYGESLMSIRVSPPLTQFTGVAASPRAVAYNGVTVLSASLSGVSPSTPLTGQIVTAMVSADGVNWRAYRNAIEDSPGHYRVSLNTTTKTFYRLRFGGTDQYSFVNGPTIVVTSKAYLSTPSASTTRPTHNKTSVTFSGYLKPKHAAGSKSVVIKAYRYENRKWKLRQTFSATNYNYNSYTKYSARFKLKYAGKWRVYAYHADANHLATTSGYRALTVK